MSAAVYKQTEQAHECNTETPAMDDSVQSLEQHLLNNTPQTERDSLTMAAKLGSALLEENELLKHQNNIMTARLQGLEAKIEDLENEENKHLAKNEHLQRIIFELEAQMAKEKDCICDIKSIFEEHDEKQELKLQEYEIKLSKQEEELSALRLKLRNKAHLSDEYMSTKEYKHSESQTDSATNSNIASHSMLITEVGLLKKGHSLLEEKMQILETKLLNMQIDNEKGEAKQDDKEHPQPPADKTLSRDPRPNLKRNPPMTAKTRGPTESAEDFLNNYLREHQVKASICNDAGKGGSTADLPQCDSPSSIVDASTPPPEICVPPQAGTKAGSLLTDFLDTQHHPKRQNLPKLHTENENEEPPKNIKNGQKLNKLTILHQNIRGLTKKVNRLNHILSERSPSLLILTEHGLSQGELENTNITGYSLITEYSRTNHRLGGVAVYSAESLMSTVEVVDVSQHSLELVCEVAMIRIRVKNHNINILGLYRPRETT
ncbi:hypothetical protein J6590_019720 [Homalodisca vitripennis]|nr:hypothetical protein J6590_019720 [Homalodisca vitripennis]